MLIRISGRAEVLHAAGKAVTERSIIGELGGVKSDDVCSNYLEGDLADLGIAGGAIGLSHDEITGQCRVVTEYTSPVELKPAQLNRLARETVGQWSDGIGEGCFDEVAARLGIRIEIASLEGDRDLRVEQVGEVSKGPKKPSIAKAAREGDTALLRKRLDAGADLEGRQQGYTPLHLAVNWGHAEAALELIARGADVNAVTAHGHDALMLCALSNSCHDAAATRIARALLERGALLHGRNRHGNHSALFMAKNRAKTELTALLAGLGATDSRPD